MGAIRINLGAEFRHNLAIDRHTPSRDPFLGLSPRRQSSSSNDFL
jgi:hypothetical protein